MLTQDQLNAVYREVLGRDAPTTDLAAWNAVGANISDYRNALIATPEFNDRFSLVRQMQTGQDAAANPQNYGSDTSGAVTRGNNALAQWNERYGGGLSGPAAPQPPAQPPRVTSDQQANGYGLPPGVMPYYGPMNPGAVDYGFGMQGMYGMMPPWGMWGFGGGLNNMWGQTQAQAMGAQTGAPFNAGIGTNNPTQFNYQAGDRTQEYAGAPSSNPMDTGRGFGFQFRRGGYARRYRRGGLARLAA